MLVEGIAGWRSRFDERDREIELSYFGVDKNPALRSEGYAVERYRYDERGNQIEVSYFGLDGKLVLVEGMAGTRSRFDERDQEIERPPTTFTRDLRIELFPCFLASRISTSRS